MKIVNSVLAFLFPPRATEQIVANLTEEELREAYAPKTYDGCIALTSYRDPRIRACIHEIKFHNNERAAYLLGSLLGMWIHKYVENGTHVIPIPLSKKRLRTRGYNQVARIVDYAITYHDGLTLSPSLVLRTRTTTPQTELPKEKRLQNMENAFMCPPHATLEGMSLLLVDDVYTTGATMKSAREALLAHNPRAVTCVTIAH